MMQRQFNSGVNQLPQSTIRANPYPISGTLKAGQAQADRYGIFEIDDFDLSTGTYTVKRPTADSLAAAQCLFSPANLEAGQLASFGMTGAFWVALDTSGGAPSVGDDVGTQTDSYKLLKDNTGFKCIAYNATEELCLVRPFSSSGITVTEIFDSGASVALWNVSQTVTGLTEYADSWQTLDSSFSVTTGDIFSVFIGMSGFSGTDQVLSAENINCVKLTAGSFESNTVSRAIEFADAGSTILAQPHPGIGARSGVKGESIFTYFNDSINSAQTTYYRQSNLHLRMKAVGTGTATKWRVKFTFSGIDTLTSTFSQADTAPTAATRIGYSTQDISTVWV